jgi:hypothetical protein
VLVAAIWLWSVAASAQSGGTLAQLPRSVHAEAGRFTIFADYGALHDGFVPVYLDIRRRFGWKRS